MSVNSVGITMAECAVSFFVLALLVFGSSAYRQDTDDKKEKTALWNATETDLLKRDLLHGYDKFARPAQRSNVTHVNINLVFKHVHIDDSRFLMTINAWVQMSWNDYKLKWDASKYGGLTIVHMADHEIWQPDITLYNSAAGNNMDHYGNTHCVVTSYGHVLWVPPALFSVFCDLDLSQWPFDSHTCSLTLGSWTYSGEQINLTTSGGRVSDTDIAGIETSEWRVKSIRKERNVKRYVCCIEPYIEVTFNVTVERKSATYHSVLVLPTIGMVFMTLSLFWLPSHTQERFILSAVIIILICIYLIYFSYRLPIMGANTPLIVKFYSYHLTMVVLAIIISVATFNLSLVKKPVPWYITTVLRGPVGRILGVQHQQVDYGEEMNGGGDEMRPYDETREERGMLPPSQPGKQWSTVAAALDRLVFLLYVLVFSCLALSCAI